MKQAVLVFLSAGVVLYLWMTIKHWPECRAHGHHWTYCLGIPYPEPES